MRLKNEYYFLSNMCPCANGVTVNLDGNGPITFKCSESAYQAAKFPGRFGEFVNLNGYEAKSLARQLVKQGFITKDWDNIKLSVMENVVRAKFDQNPSLVAKLIAVQEEIVEHNEWGDTYWGVCKGVGKNMLGKLLAQIREEKLNPRKPNKDFYLLIAGSRGFNDYETLCARCDSLLSRQSGKKIHIVQGEARGTDTLAKRYAMERGFEVHSFPADWSTGKDAGYRRNERMHKFLCQFPLRGCVCFWDGQSKGTQHNFELCKQCDTPLRIWDYSKSIYVKPV